MESCSKRTYTGIRHSIHYNLSVANLCWASSTVVCVLFLCKSICNEKFRGEDVFDSFICKIFKVLSEFFEVSFEKSLFFQHSLFTLEDFLMWTRPNIRQPLSNGLGTGKQPELAASPLFVPSLLATGVANWPRGRGG